MRNIRSSLKMISTCAIIHRNFGRHTHTIPPQFAHTTSFELNVFVFIKFLAIILNFFPSSFPRVEQKKTQIVNICCVVVAFFRIKFAHLSAIVFRWQTDSVDRILKSNWNPLRMLMSAKAHRWYNFDCINSGAFKN